MAQVAPVGELISELQEDYLTCPIHHGVYTQPKALPCLHTFCYQCLLDFVRSRGVEGGGTFSCPICCRTVEVPPGGVENFVDNHLITSLLERLSCHEGSGFTEQECLVRNRAQVARDWSRRHTSDVGLQSYVGCYGSGLVDLRDPIGLACIPGKYILVSDRHSNRILIYTVDGQIMSMFMVQGQVCDLAVTPGGHILVAVDQFHHGIVILYTLSGQVVKVYGDGLSGTVTPHGVAPMEDGRVLVTTPDTNAVYLFRESGAIQRQCRGTSSTDGLKLKHPSYVTTYKTHILVSNTSHHNIKVLDSFTGNCIYQFGGHGRETGQLERPSGLCLDGNDNVIIADSGNHRVQVFSMSGRYQDVAVQMRDDEIAQDLRPVAVAMVDRDTLAVLVTGPSAAQIQLHRYRPAYTAVPTVTSAISCTLL